MTALDLFLLVLALPGLACATYLFALALAAKRPASATDDRAPTLRFDIVVPAHDEEAGIADTVASLLALDYPPHLRRILVVADNCGDTTAACAIAAGATVLVRDDPAQRGKGHALAHAFRAIERDDQADAVVVIDADTTVSPNLLRAFARRFAAGAGAAQADYGVRNPEASWRTRVMVVALALFHVLRSLGRERLGLSAGLRGNGMALTRATLARVPYEAFSIVEDVEYGIRLGEAGCRVHYAGDAHVWGEMVARESASRSQRRRWESGRQALALTHGPRLLLAAVRTRDPVLLDLALDLLVPPLTSLALAVFTGALVTLVRLALGHPLAPALPWLVAAAFLAVHIARGLHLSGVGPRGLLALLVSAPAYVVWKIALSLRRADRSRGEWVRTEREARRGP